MGIMFKPAITTLVAGLLLCGAVIAQAPKKSAFDKAELETYVRHLWVVPANMSVAVGEARTSDLAGFQEVPVKISQGQASQEVILYVSKDGNKVLQGNVYDINFNPFKKELDKIKTSFQPSLG